VVFLEFVIDPACTLVFETEQRGREVMRRPPRDPRRRLFSRSMVLESAALGVTGLIAAVLVYGAALQLLPSEDEARALGFVALVAGNLAMILVNRSRHDSLAAVLIRPNAAFWWICVLAAAALALVLAVPPAAEAFAFGRPPVVGILAATVLGGGAVAVLGYLRPTRGRRGARHGGNAGRI
jgi:Ca2+-transporting ATPase